jgi:hypothetical protein
MGMSTAGLSVLSMCCCAVVADLYLMYVSWRKSPLGTIVALVILQILLGTAVVPIAIAAGLYGGGFHGNQYFLQNDPPGIAAAAHLGLFSIGGIVGWHFGVRSSFSRRAVTILSRPLLKLDAFRCAAFLLIFSFGCYVTLFILIDWDVLLSNARGGSRDAYGGNQGYLFLKSLASVGMWSVCFLPSILKHCNRRKIVFIAALLLCYVCLTFVIAISRNLLLWSILVPVIVLVRYSGASQSVKLLAAMAVVLFASVVLLYGKSFSQVQRRLVSNGEWSSLESSNPEGLASAVISNLEFQWYSVDAGIKNFLSGGPMPVAELGLAMAVGYVPSRMLDSVGLGFLSYVSYGDDGVIPINSRYFSLADGTVPPGTVGYSAYLGPWVMGFAIGFLLLYSLASVLQFSCHSGLRHGCSISWFFALLLVNWFSFIPMACALATFGALLIFGLSLTRVFAPR